ncbi:MAG TPA: zinc-binding dehydrogenase [Puia sp.]|nr:zinc-binding dehydrogenase [Puia sp.]
MRALVLTNGNEPLNYRELPDPVPGVGEALVELKAAALNHRDIWIQMGKYAGIRYPVILGSDGSGVVIATGMKQDAEWIGRQIVINPALHWGNSESHQDPKDFQILGLPANGTFAEYVVVPISNLSPKPLHMDVAESAALPLAGVTAYRATIKRANVQPGESVLVTGIGGGVALFALQFAMAAGASVYVTSGTEQKIRRAVALGALGGVNYNNAGWTDELRKISWGFDVIVDGAAGDGLDSLLDLVKPGGRVVLYGATRGYATSLTARRIFWKQINLLGSTMGSPADFAQMVRFTELNVIKPVIDCCYSLEQGELAMQKMSEGIQFGKIVLRISGASG